MPHVVGLYVSRFVLPRQPRLPSPPMEPAHRRTAKDVAVEQAWRLPVAPLLWAALAMVPVMTVLELAGPRPLNLTLRALWVALVAVVMSAAVLRATCDRPTRR